MTIKQAFDEFIMSKRADGLSDKSIEAYKWQMQHFVCIYGEFCLNNTENEYNLLTNAHIQEYLVNLMECEKWSYSTKVSYRRSVRIFLKWCSNEYDDIAIRYERIRLLKMPKKEIALWKPEEIQMIFDVCEKSPEWLGIRDKLIIALLIDTGIRRQELCSLKKKDIDFNSHEMIVTGKGRKQRKAHYGDTVAEIMQEYLQKCPYDQETLLCGLHNESLTGNGISQVLYKIQRKTGIQISPHRCRHNFATNYCLDTRALGREVDPNKLQALMGHEDMVTTKRYMHDALEITAADTCPSHLDLIRNKKTAS